MAMLNLEVRVAVKGIGDGNLHLAKPGRESGAPTKLWELWRMRRNELHEQPIYMTMKHVKVRFDLCTGKSQQPSSDSQRFSVEPHPSPS